MLRHNEIAGYDKENGENVWNIDVDGSIVTARLYKNRIYVITRNHLDYYDSIKPVRVNGKALEIKYFDIYYPIRYKFESALHCNVDQPREQKG